jgi:hypothetical protein
MSKAIAFSRHHADMAVDAIRFLIVAGCACALIAAG